MDPKEFQLRKQKQKNLYVNSHLGNYFYKKINVVQNTKLLNLSFINFLNFRSTALQSIFQHTIGNLSFPLKIFKRTVRKKYWCVYFYL